MNKMEFRFKPVDLHFKENSDNMVVSGYVNLTEQFSNVLRTQHSNYQFIEKISKGAFTRALERNKDIDFLAEHDNTLILSSTRNKSLELYEDDKGLYMSAIISPTSWGKDYYTLIKDGILRNFSFGFRALEDTWEERADGLLERQIQELELFEVSVVRNPAYPQSNIQARNLDVVSDDEFEAKIKEVRKLKKEELEKREELLEDTEETEENGLETQIISLERTVLALELKIDKMFKMLEEALMDKVVEEDEEEPVEEDVIEETNEEVPEGRSDEPIGEVVEMRDETPVEEDEEEPEVESTEEVEAEIVEDEEVETEKEPIEEDEERSVSDKIEENEKILDETYHELRNKIKDLKGGK